jgi:DNA-binding ferritin-like protein
MEKPVINLLKLQNQLRILHWQTESYAEHKAFGKAYDDLDELIDELVEVYQGKRGRIKYDSPVELNLVNYDEISIMNVLEQFQEYLEVTFTAIVDPSKDTDLLNIRDAILGTINRLKYLLTLK